ncbi:MAG: FHA domain-containing protein [Myxococcota bacterium]
MTDAELAEELKSLGMDQVSYRSLPLLPLIQVAWADGEVQEAERSLILRLAEDRFALGEEGRRLVRNWLHHAPSRAYVHRGQVALAALCHREGFARDELADVVEFAKQVARAAGGFFGIGSVAAEEAGAIDEIAAALDIPHDRPWATPDDPTVIPADADSESDGPPPEVVFHTAELGSVRSRGTLVQYDDLRGERTCPVLAGEGITIGRNRDNAIQITYDGQVSRRHCRVFLREGRYYVEDLGSTRGTWVNGERVLERRLLGGETLHLGHATFFFQLSPEDSG